MKYFNRLEHGVNLVLDGAVVGVYVEIEERCSGEWVSGFS